MSDLAANCNKDTDDWRIAECAATQRSQELISKKTFNAYLRAATREGNDPDTTYYSMGLTTGAQQMIVAGTILDPEFNTQYSMSYNPRDLINDYAYIVMHTVDQVPDVPEWSPHSWVSQHQGTERTKAIFRMKEALPTKELDTTDCARLSRWLDDNGVSRWSNIVMVANPRHWCPSASGGSVDIVVAELTRREFKHQEDKARSADRQYAVVNAIELHHQMANHNPKIELPRKAVTIDVDDITVSDYDEEDTSEPVQKIHNEDATPQPQESAGEPPLFSWERGMKKADHLRAKLNEKLLLLQDYLIAEKMETYKNFTDFTDCFTHGFFNQIAYKFVVEPLIPKIDLPLAIFSGAIAILLTYAVVSFIAHRVFVLLPLYLHVYLIWLGDGQGRLVMLPIMAFIVWTYNMLRKLFNPSRPDCLYQASIVPSNDPSLLKSNTNFLLLIQIIILFGVTYLIYSNPSNSPLLSFWFILVASFLMHVVPGFGANNYGIYFTLMIMVFLFCAMPGVQYKFEEILNTVTRSASFPTLSIHEEFDPDYITYQD
ncbi:hypothetical protein QAD02_004575 [Eretmocerus hayati]|uniref:Uncharacterized protein n=1 Tax=Eretmocerus hayati TaxID=131215 RepID=A0ACC2NQ48_9HYME|nr:hypothetical protein QAD02_004575 [Eretmocerus hayati]